MKACLVVDDSSVVRLVARRILETMDFVVEEAADGGEALAACGARMPDLVLLDWDMPHKNGLDMLKALRAMPGGDTPMVVFCASQNDPARIADALAAGATEFVMKPFDGAILRSKLALIGALDGTAAAELG